MPSHPAELHIFSLSLRNPWPWPSLPRHDVDGQNKADTPRDTIDLQDHDAPSAKDHRQSHRPTGAHQAETLREVAHESAEEHARSPRLSWNDAAAADNNTRPQEAHGQDDLAAGVSSRMHQQQQQQQQQANEQEQQQQQQEDDLAVSQNGGISSSDEGDLDGDDLDDDMMDRISSSPSIEDGAYNNPSTLQITRVPSLPLHLPDWRPSSSGSSSSYLDAPEYLPLGIEEQDSNSHHLLRRERDENDIETNDDDDDDADESWLYGAAASLPDATGDGELELHLAPHG